MYYYKLMIKSGPMLEIKYYKSLRPRNKKHIGRSTKRGLTPEKQQKANDIRAEKQTQRLILENFTPGDWFCRFSAPYENFTEEQFENIVRNFFRRIKYYAKKQNLTFKYVGFCECGKRGGNWHLHIVIEDKLRKIAQDCWQWQDGINFTPLYQKGNFEALAHYIRKDVSGKKRIKTSRNLRQPTYEVTEYAKRDFNRLDKGEMITIPKGYYLVEDEKIINDYTGANYNFTFCELVNKKYAGSGVLRI